MTISDVQQLYISYFDRPADPSGLQYWQELLDNGKVSMATIGNAFSASAEFQAAHAGQSNSVLINRIYISLFGHDADTGGLLYWTDLVNHGALTPSQVVGAIGAGALGSDAVALSARTSFATAFTNYVTSTPDGAAAYNGPAAIIDAQMRLSVVHDQASLDAQLALLGKPGPVFVIHPITAGGAPVPEHVAVDGAGPVVLVGVADASHIVTHG